MKGPVHFILGPTCLLPCLVRQQEAFSGMLHVPPRAQQPWGGQPQAPWPPAAAQWTAQAAQQPVAAQQPHPATGWGAVAAAPQPPPQQPPVAGIGSAVWAWPDHPLQAAPKGQAGPTPAGAWPRHAGVAAAAGAQKARGAGSAATEASSARVSALRALNRRITRALSVEVGALGTLAKGRCYVA